MFFILSMIMATVFIVLVIVLAEPSGFAMIGVVGVMSGAMWMPYLIAFIVYNTDKGSPCSGLYKKLAYAPLKAQVELFTIA